MIKRLVSYGGYSWGAAGFTAVVSLEDLHDGWSVEWDDRPRPGSHPALGAGAIGVRRIVANFTFPDGTGAASIYTAFNTLMGKLAPDQPYDPDAPRYLVAELMDGSATPVRVPAVIERPHGMTPNAGRNGFLVTFLATDPAWRLVTPDLTEISSIPGMQSGSTWSSVAIPNDGHAIAWPLIDLDPVGREANADFRWHRTITLVNNNASDITNEVFEIDLGDTTGWSAIASFDSDHNVWVFRDGKQVGRELVAFDEAQSTMWVFIDHLGGNGSTTQLMLVYGGTSGPSLVRLTGTRRPAFDTAWDVAEVGPGSTTTAIEFDPSPGWYTDQFDNGHILFLTGLRAGEGRRINSNDADTINVSAGLTGAPADGDFALIRHSWDVVSPGGSARRVYNVLQSERSDLARGLWYLNTGQNRPDNVLFDTPGSWEPFLFLDNQDEKNQTDFARINVGTLDSFAILDASRAPQGGVVGENQGAADGVRFASIWPIEAWDFDGSFDNPNGMCHAFFGSRPNETREWSEVRDVTTATVVGAGPSTFSNVGNTLDANTHHLCAVILPRDDALIDGSWQKITGSRTAGGTSGTATMTDATKAGTFPNDQFNGGTFVVTGGVGAGQRRTVSDYVGSTGQFTLSSNFSTTLDDTSRYEVTMPPLVANLRTHQNWHMRLDLSDLSVGALSAETNSYPATLILRMDGGATGTTYPYYRLRVGLADRFLMLPAITVFLKLDCANKRAWIEDASGNEVLDATPYVVAERVLSATRVINADWLPTTPGAHTLYVQNQGITNFNLDCFLSWGYLG